MLGTVRKGSQEAYIYMEERNIETNCIGKQTSLGFISPPQQGMEDKTESAGLSLTYNLQNYEIAPPESESESRRKSVLETMQFSTEVHIFYTIEYNVCKTKHIKSILHISKDLHR